MQKIFDSVIMRDFIEHLGYRSDVHPRLVLRGLRDLRDQMREHIEAEAMEILKREIAEIENVVEKPTAT